MHGCTNQKGEDDDKTVCCLHDSTAAQKAQMQLNMTEVRGLYDEIMLAPNANHASTQC